MVRKSGKEDFLIIDEFINFWDFTKIKDCSRMESPNFEENKLLVLEKTFNPLLNKLIAKMTKKLISSSLFGKIKLKNSDVLVKFLFLLILKNSQY